jgi:hypothetical protein
MLEVTILESVGSCIDNDYITYPMNADNTPDINSGVNLVDCCDEWYDNLNNNDVKLIVNLLMKKVLVS